MGVICHAKALVREVRQQETLGETGHGCMGMVSHVLGHASWVTPVLWQVGIPGTEYPLRTRAVVEAILQ